MNPLLKCSALTLLALGTVGCVSQQHADNLQTLYRRSQEQVIELQSQLEEKQAQIDALAARSGPKEAQLAEQLAKATTERDRLAKALAEAEKGLRSVRTGPILSPELDAALGNLAASDPNLISYDPTQGMVKLRSDLTFALGSAEVNPQAKASLARFAEILNSPMAADYTACIVGHTDNVPISKPATRAQHPTNWHLSVHRAIAVMDELQKAGVPAVRMGVAGYGEYRPITANADRSGNPANRRVEIYLVKNTSAAAAAQTAPPSASSASTIDANELMYKGGGSTSWETSPSEPGQEPGGAQPEPFTPSPDTTPVVDIIPTEEPAPPVK